MKVLMSTIVAITWGCGFAAITPAVEDVVSAPRLSTVHIGGKPGELMSKSLNTRVFSNYARTTVYEEAVNAFETHWDDSDGHTGWQNEYWGKTMLCYAGAVSLTDDPELKAWVLGRTHEFVTKYQKPNGYLSTYGNEDKIGQRKLGDNARGIWNFSIWGRKYTMWALIELYHVTGDKICLNAAEKMADHLIEQLKRVNTPIELTGSWAGLSPMTILKPLLLLYRDLEKPEYLELARHIIAVNDKDDKDKLTMNLIRDALSNRPVASWFGDEAMCFAKAYELMSFFEGVAEFHRVTGDVRSLEALKAFQRHLVDEEMNPMRSAGYFDHFLGARKRVNGMTELCDVTHWIRLNRELWLLTGEAKYLDLIEEAFYNAFLAGVTPDGAWGAHIVRSHGTRHLTAPSQTGMKYHQCCPDNMLRTFYDWASTVVGKTTDGIVTVNLYSDATVKIGGAEIEIAGGYPITDTFRVKARMDKLGKLRFRVPYWSKGIVLNGKEMQPKSGWCEVIAPEGDSSWTIAFDFSPRILDSAAPLFENVWTRDAKRDYFPPRGYTIHFMEWYTSEMRGLVRDYAAAQVMRGPIVLAKGRLAGTTRTATLDSETINKLGWSASLKPAKRTAANASTWGAWILTLERNGESKVFPVADYWSVSNVDDPDNWFSLWF